MRLISVDELKEWVKNWFDVNRNYHPYSKQNNIPIPELYDILERMPSIEERKTGKWLFPYGDKKYKRCSVCERDYYSIPHNSNFCPNCGADMRGEGHE